ncbi:unnamed protein product [Didymodactylos carnosus]|uniref:Uncharacterized protein n=1 Tax=Didymodactylos carnosus TaxID=1234261 RepID=A0A814LMC4_9BILA|nr:unnamed protein product [Didymodactylos carnosus]CAF3834543.1 unnamed protein product [Didymodactylos carnosus]
MLFDDDNTAYTIEPYVSPTRVLRCYICQQYDDHIAAYCPNKDKPICFKCGQQHSYNPDCQNEVCCVHCKGGHMAGNPNCPKKIETRDLKKLQRKSSSLISTNLSYTNRWTGNSARYLFGNSTTTTNNNANDNNRLMEMIDTIHVNIQTVSQQQSDLIKLFNDLSDKTNNQVKETVNINQVLNEIVCPLLKDVTNIIYTQINPQQKQQIKSAHNKLVSYLDHKVFNQSSFTVQHILQSSQQIQAVSPQTTARSDDTNIDMGQ